MSGYSISASTLIISFVYFITIINKLSLAQTIDYCDVSTCDVGKHTLCRYPNPIKKGPDSCLSGDEKADYLRIHNEYRTKLANGKVKRGKPGPQPPASNLRYLSWDHELATAAQRWSEQTNHSVLDKCRDMDRFAVGQNVATICGMDESVPFALNMWWKTASSFNPKYISSYKLNTHSSAYTLMAWARVSRVGCGRTHYYNKEVEDYCDKIVCNYAPSGNYEGHPVYKIGKAASDCKYGVSKDWPSLCN